jgi:hypothetical protein
MCKVRIFFSRAHVDIFSGDIFAGYFSWDILSGYVNTYIHIFQYVLLLSLKTNWYVLKSNLESDHFLISRHLFGFILNAENDFKPRLKMEKADWKFFTSLCESNINLLFAIKSMINNFVKEFLLDYSALSRIRLVVSSL